MLDGWQIRFKKRDFTPETPHVYLQEKACKNNDADDNNMLYDVTAHSATVSYL